MAEVEQRRPNCLPDGSATLSVLCFVNLCFGRQVQLGGWLAVGCTNAPVCSQYVLYYTWAACEDDRKVPAWIWLCFLKISRRLITLAHMICGVIAPMGSFYVFSLTTQQALTGWQIFKSMMLFAIMHPEVICLYRLLVCVTDGWKGFNELYMFEPRALVNNHPL